MVEIAFAEFREFEHMQYSLKSRNYYYDITDVWKKWLCKNNLP